MNLAIRGINGNLGGKPADSFHNDLHKDLKADYILANPPFNVSEWGAEHVADDIRWKYGIPYNGNANYAWVQHFIHHLAPTGTAGFVLANGALSSNTSSEGDVREKILEDDLVDCIVALPPKLFYSTSIPVSLWFLSKNKGGNGGRKRDGETLFIDARNTKKFGKLIDRSHRELRSKDIKKISDTYHAWKGTAEDIEYEDIAGFCKAAKLEEIREHEHILTPGRYVGIEEKDEDDESFEDKMARLTDELAEQFAKSNKLEEEIRDNLRVIGYEF